MNIIDFFFLHVHLALDLSYVMCYFFLMCVGDGLKMQCMR